MAAPTERVSVVSDTISDSFVNGLTEISFAEISFAEIAFAEIATHCCITTIPSNLVSARSSIDLFYHG